MVTATQRAMGMTSTQAMAMAIRVANNEEGYCKGGKSEGNGIEEGNGDKMGNGNSNNRGDGHGKEGGEQHRGQWEKTTIN